MDVIDTVENAIKWFNNHQCPDLIFSDIQLSDGLSFEIYKQIEVKCPIIFTTAYDEYMFEAFKTNGIDYLLKPIQESELERSIEKYHQLGGEQNPDSGTDLNALIEAVTNPMRKYKERFLVKIGAKLIPVQSADIAYFQYSDGSTEIITKDGKKYLWDQSLDDLERPG